MVRRFFQEAQIAGQLQHPGIPAVYEIGRLPDGRPFIAMKLVKGATLEDLLAHRHDDAIDDQIKLLGIFGQISQTIGYAHQRGVIHRDLKPANVMVGEFGEVQVMDWGIAKLAVGDLPVAAEREVLDAARGEASAGVHVNVDTDGRKPATRVGQIMGTPGYMAPEQVFGRGDKTADVFSLGAILCEILTGEKLTGEGHAVAAQLDRCQCDQELADLAKYCLRKNPADRPQHAGIVAERISAHLNALQARLQDARIAAARAELEAKEERRRRQRTVWQIAVVTIFLVTAGLCGLLVRHAVMERQETTRANGLVDQLLTADIERVPLILESLEACKWRVVGRIGTQFEQSKVGSAERLHLALALPRGDDRKLECLRDHLLRATPIEFPVVRAALTPQKNRLTDSLWQLARDEDRDAAKRFRALAAWAEYGPADERWNSLAPFVAAHMTGSIPSAYLGQWLQHMRRALIQSLGSLDLLRIRSAERSRITEQVQQLYTNDTDPGVHSSAAWALRKWGVTLPPLASGAPVVTEERALLSELQKVRRWYVNSEGQTMVVIANVLNSAELGIDYDFAIASHEVTVAEFLRFRAEHEVSRLVAATDDCPVHYVSWHMAAACCNWLSAQDGIPQDEWVYVPKSNSHNNEMTSKENDLELRGYRLPTAAQWKYACRGGTHGTYSFGEPLALLPQYAHCASAQSHSVESFLPNEAGLFDMHGNVWECCHAQYANGRRQQYYGGSYRLAKPFPSSSRSVISAPANFRDSKGFRVARTYRCSSVAAPFEVDCSQLPR